jgi:hypothetical protein
MLDQGFPNFRPGAGRAHARTVTRAEVRLEGPRQGPRNRKPSQLSDVGSPWAPHRITDSDSNPSKDQQLLP